MRFYRARTVLGVGLVLCVLPVQIVLAGSILLPEGDTIPGLRGSLMAGAQSALADGAEAAWFNPAGLARAPENSLIAGGALLEHTELIAGGARSSTLAAGPGYISYVAGPVRGSRPPAWSWGVHAYWPTQQNNAGSFAETGTLQASALPGALTGGNNFDADFPDGVRFGSAMRGHGELRTLAAGLTLALAAWPWLRVGVGLDLERVHLRTESTLEIGYTAQTASGNLLSGNELAASFMEGQAERAVLRAGVQLDFGPRVTVGLHLRRPAGALGGRGTVRYARARRLSVTRTALGTFEGGETVTAVAEDVAFDLRLPPVLGLGVALVFDTLAVEFDMTFAEALAAYPVFPDVGSAAPSTNAVTFPDVTTARRAVTRYALGIALSGLRRGTLLAGLSVDESPVPNDDELFTSLGSSTLGLGYYWPLHNGAVSAGLVYRAGSAAAVRPPPVAGLTASRVNVALQTLRLTLGWGQNF